MTRRRLIGFVALVQLVLGLTHLLLYETWTFSLAQGDPSGLLWIKLVLAFLSVSFVGASLLAFRYTNAAVRWFYKATAVWMVFVSFLFFAAVVTLIIFVNLAVSR